MPRRKKTAIDLPTDLSAALELGVKTVLGDKHSTNAERVQALNAGIKLLQAKHKIDSSKDDSGDFFPSAAGG